MIKFSGVVVHCNEDITGASSAFLCMYGESLGFEFAEMVLK